MDRRRMMMQSGEKKLVGIRLNKGYIYFPFTANQTLQFHKYDTYIFKNVGALLFYSRVGLRNKQYCLWSSGNGITLNNARIDYGDSASDKNLHNLFYNWVGRIVFQTIATPSKITLVYNGGGKSGQFVFIGTMTENNVTVFAGEDFIIYEIECEKDGIPYHFLPYFDGEKYGLIDEYSGVTCMDETGLATPEYEYREPSPI